MLPLCEGILTEQRAASFEPPPYPDRQEYVYRPGGGAIITRSFLTGFRLLADIDVPVGIRASGIICAHHIYTFGATVPGGWACYVLDGRLIVAFEATGVTTRIAADDVSLAGRHVIGVAYFPEPGAEGRLLVTLDGRESGADHIPASAGPAVLQYLEGKLLIGRDEGFSLSADYQPPFPFTGRIDRVSYAVPPSQPRDLRDDFEGALRRD